MSYLDFERLIMVEVDARRVESHWVMHPAPELSHRIRSGVRRQGPKVFTRLS
jgi:hypothetical protein